MPPKGGNAKATATQRRVMRVTNDEFERTDSPAADTVAEADRVARELSLVEHTKERRKAKYAKAKSTGNDEEEEGEQYAPDSQPEDDEEEDVQGTDENADENELGAAQEEAEGEAESEGEPAAGTRATRTSTRASSGQSKKAASAKLSKSAQAGLRRLARQPGQAADDGDESEAPPPAGQRKKQSQSSGSSKQKKSARKNASQHDMEEDHQEEEGEEQGDEASQPEDEEDARRVKQQKAAKQAKATQRSGGNRSGSTSSSRDRDPIQVKGSSYRTFGERTFWTEEETQCLKETLDDLCCIQGMANVYSTVLALHGVGGKKSTKLERRTPVQLKDKAVNICKKALREGELIPYWKNILCSRIWVRCL